MRKTKTLPDINLSHREHLEALATTHGASGPEWCAIGASLYVLKLTDRLAVAGLGAPSLEERVRGTALIDAVSRGDSIVGPLRRALAALQAQDRIALANALKDLGRARWSQAAWTLAIDTYSTATLVAREAGDVHLGLECRFGVGYALRMLRRLDEAEHHYAAMRQCAERFHDVRYGLEARLGSAKVAIDRGDFDRATPLLAAITQDARDANCSTVVSKALQDRGRIAFESRDYTPSLELAYEAMTLCEDARDRDRLLQHVAQCLAHVGERDAARDAGLLLLATAQEQEIRWLASSLLMEIACEDGRPDVFERYRASLSAEPMPPMISAWYYGDVGKGCRAFGRTAEAKTAFTRMLSIARQNGLRAAEREALMELATLERTTTAPVSRRVPTGGPTVRRIAAAITQQRVAARVQVPN